MSGRWMDADIDLLRRMAASLPFVTNDPSEVAEINNFQVLKLVDSESGANGFVRVLRIRPRGLHLITGDSDP